eukprot:COSAG01_NODE_386_length_17742_cov_25.176654_6_plen_79_part_00
MLLGCFKSAGSGCSSDRNAYITQHHIVLFRAHPKGSLGQLRKTSVLQQPRPIASQPGPRIVPVVFISQHLEQNEGPIK